jgi:hypothetical protein
VPRTLGGGIIVLVATRKQRRRRQKLQRHEYEYVVETEDGEEIPLDELREHEQARPGSRAERKGEPNLVDRRGRPIRPPSFERVIRRTAIFAPILFLFVYFTSRDRLDLMSIVVNTLILVAFFIPFSYLVDKMVYRMVLRRHEREQAERRGR